MSKEVQKEKWRVFYALTELQCFSENYETCGLVNRSFRFSSYFKQNRMNEMTMERRRIVQNTTLETE